MKNAGAFYLCVSLLFLSGQPLAAAGSAHGRRPSVQAFAGPGTLRREDPAPPAPAPVQSPTPEPEESASPTPEPDPEVERLERETRLAAARKALAEAEKEEAEARQGKAEAEQAEITARQAAAKVRLGIGAADASPTPPAGSISAGEDPKFIETQLLAEAGARMASVELVRQMCNGAGPTPATPIPALTEKPIRTLVINSPTDKASIGHYRTIVGQLQFLHEHYERLIKQSREERDDARQEAAALPLLVPAATQMVKNVADLFNLFRTDTEYKNQEVSVAVRLIVSAFANSLLTADTTQCKVKAIYQPAVYPLSVPKDVKSGPLLGAYRRLLDDVGRGETEVNDNKKKVAALTARKGELEEQLAALKEKLKESGEGAGEAAEKLKSNIKSGQEFIGKIDRRIDRLNRAAENLEAFKGSVAGLLGLLTAVDDATKQPLLVGLISAERLSEILAADDTYALDLTVKASGTNRIRRNMFFNAKLAHTGGVSIDANLYNHQDQLVFGRLEDYYIEFTGSEDIRKRMGFQKLDKLRR
ncbi:MAG TPA: hypothetical protein VG148_03505 [Pyrinomonadaceae bacterium]|nr:hypothetical protein [Pyrinomonadaceae bacterium]